MTPTHSNKKGVRYRYYTSHALLQGRKMAAGKISRVSAPEIEARVVAALRESAADSHPHDLPDRQLVEAHLSRVAIRENRLEITLKSPCGAADKASVGPIHVAWSAPALPRQGIAHQQEAPGTIDDDTRTALLAAIARSRAWIDALISGEAASFADIAQSENLAERHVRVFAALAYLSPRVVQEIVDGRVRAGTTVRDLAKNPPGSWNQQEARFL